MAAIHEVAMTKPDAEERILEASGELDAHAAETLALEIRRLARRHGLDPDEIRIEVEDTAPPSA